MRVKVGGLLAAVLAIGAVQTSHSAFPGDNGRIAYASGGMIHTVDPDGSDRRTLTKGANPAFSPDGSELLYSCEGQICVIGDDGTGQRELTTDPSFRSEHPNWSPSGEEIVFRRRRLLNTSREPADLFVINADGTDERALDETGNDPVWSPDGRRIAFTKGNQGIGIYLIRPDGSDVEQIHEGEGYIHSLSWAPDGERTAFTMHRRNFWRIMVVRRDGSGYREVFRGRGKADSRYEVSGRGIAWAPNGKRIVYYNLLKDRLCFVRLTGRRAGCLEQSGQRPDWGVKPS